MKLLLILISIFLHNELYSPVRNQKKDDKLIQNTDINFNTIVFSKLEIKFYQIGCYNHDRYRMNFTKVNNGVCINIYGHSTSDCENFKFNEEESDKLLVSRYLKNDELKHLKDILVTDQNEVSTMYNIIDINYKGAIYKFHDNSVSPEWRKYIYNLTNNM
jgi:hypothetical protein